MASTYSALKIELIATGEQAGTWGATTNVNLGDAALGEAITGSADVAFSSADVTVTLTDTNTTQAARNLRLNLTGTSGGARNLILGSGCQIEKLYLVNNGLADAVTIKNTTGTGIAIPAGKSAFVFNNGTNVVEAVNYAASISTGAITCTSLTDSGLTSGRVTYAGTAGLLQDSANLTFNGTTLTANTIGAYTLSGTIAGGGNQLNNIIIGTSTPLAGSFTTINASTSITNAGLTSGRVTYAGTAGLLQDSANLTFSGTDLNLTSAAGAVRYTATGATAMALYADNTAGYIGTENNFPLVFQTNNAGRMWLNATGLGIGTSSPTTVKLSVFSGGAGTSGQLKLGYDDTAYWQIGRNDPAGTGSGNFQFKPDGGATVFDITSAGLVGIGTSSPSSPLTIAKAGATAIEISSGATFPVNAYGATTGITFFAIANTGGTSYFGNESSVAGTSFTGSDAYATIVGTGAARSLQFITNNVVRTTIDSSGNLGLGVTPSAWSGLTAFQVGQAASFFAQSGGDFIGGYVGSNIYYNAGWKYIRNGYATKYDFNETNNGQHRWWIAPNNTSGAGAAATETQAMTLTASGNLGLGTTDPDYGSYGATERILGVTGVATNRGRLSLQNTATGTTGVAGTIAFWNGSTLLASLDLNADGATNKGAYIFNTNNGTSVGERMRIDSGGAVGIGNNNAASFTTFSPKLVVGSGTGGQRITIYSGTGQEGDLIFADGVAGTEQYRGTVRYDHADDAMKFYTNGGINAMIINSAQGVQVTNTVGVGAATPSTSGAGITFPATQSASSNANTLDDYEEGTWTPVLKFGGGSTGITSSQQVGQYTKVGRLVTCTFNIFLTSKGSSTGSATIDGLPFTVLDGSGYYAGTMLQPYKINYVNGGMLTMYVDKSSNNLVFTSVPDDGGVNVSIVDTDFSNDSQVIGSFIYYV